MMDDLLKQLPDETDRAYRAFMEYLKMPLFGPNQRSIRRLAKELGYKNPVQLFNWSRKYAWQERAKAYDSTINKSALRVRQVALEEFQRAIVENTTTQLTMLNQIIMRALSQLNDKVDTGEVSTLDINRMASAIRTIDKVLRLAADMPTNTKTTSVDYEPDSGEVFVVGE